MEIQHLKHRKVYLPECIILCKHGNGFRLWYFKRFYEKFPDDLGRWNIKYKEHKQ